VNTFDLTVGHFIEPFSLEELTSDNYGMFMERALPNALVPSRNAGFMASTAIRFSDAKDTVERMTAAVGLFRNTDSQGKDQTDGGHNVTARVTAAPWYADGGRRLFHVGADYSLRSPEDPISYSARPEIHLIQPFVSTGSLDVDHTQLFGGESALVLGPFSLQGEYVSSVNELADDGSACFQGFYVQASYFLTGEHRPYRTSSGTFDRVRPRRNFRQDGGWGAWELATRYSWLDLEDENVSGGGELRDVTFGLNWYLNPNVRIMWNYIRACLEDGDAADIAAMRLAFFF
jgi:phosphate-selective porin OprO/OprP